MSSSLTTSDSSHFNSFNFNSLINNMEILKPALPTLLDYKEKECNLCCCENCNEIEQYKEDRSSSVVGISTAAITKSVFKIKIRNSIVLSISLLNRNI